MELARWSGLKRYIRRVLALAIAGAGLTVVSMVMVSMACSSSFGTPDTRSVAGWVVAGVWLAAWLACSSPLPQRTAGGRRFPLTRRELAQDWRDIRTCYE